MIAAAIDADHGTDGFLFPDQSRMSFGQKHFLIAVTSDSNFQPEYFGLPSSRQRRSHLQVNEYR